MNKHKEWMQSIYLWKRLLGYVAILLGIISFLFENYRAFNGPRVPGRYTYYYFGENHELIGIILIISGVIWLYLVNKKII